eukprot:14218606-Alexandrium_andersonii.AAC.1
MLVGPCGGGQSIPQGNGTLTGALCQWLVVVGQAQEHPRQCCQEVKFGEKANAKVRPCFFEIPHEGSPQIVRKLRTQLEQRVQICLGQLVHKRVHASTHKFCSPFALHWAMPAKPTQLFAHVRPASLGTRMSEKMLVARTPLCPACKGTHHLVPTQEHAGIDPEEW